MRKSLIIVLLTLVITAVIFGGCAQSPTPTPSPSSSPSLSPTSSPSVKPPSPTATPSQSPVSPKASVKPIELKYNHQLPTTSRTRTNYLYAWAQKVEKVTNGMVKIVEYPAESLAKQKDGIAVTTGGLADISWLVLGYYAGQFQLSSVIGLPFMSLPSGTVDGRKLSCAAVNSHIFQELYETVPELQKDFPGMKVLFLHTSDAYFVATTKKPVRNLNDLKGLKLRELAGYPTEMWKLLGASPLFLTMVDVYDALQKGVIDGLGTPWASIGSVRLYEVLKYWTDVATTVSGFGMVMNLDKWNSLSPEIQKAIMSVSGMTAAEFAGDAAWGVDAQEEVLAMMKKNNFSMERVELDSGELDKWKSIGGQPLWDKWAAEMQGKGLAGNKVRDELLRLIGKYR